MFLKDIQGYGECVSCDEEDQVRKDSTDTRELAYSHILGSPQRPAPYPYVLEGTGISSSPGLPLVSLHLSHFESNLLVIIKERMLRISPQMFHLNVS